MAKVTICFGVVLIVIGILGFEATGSVHMSALIPTWTGLALTVSGVLARTENAKRRTLWMHVAAVVGLLGFLGAGPRAIAVYIHAHGSPLAYPVAVADEALLAVICLVYVLLCVWSFIAARSSRETAA